MRAVHAAWDVPHTHGPSLAAEPSVIAHDGPAVHRSSALKQYLPVNSLPQAATPHVQSFAFSAVPSVLMQLLPVPHVLVSAVQKKPDAGAQPDMPHMQGPLLATVPSVWTHGGADMQRLYAVLLLLDRCVE